MQPGFAIARRESPFLFWIKGLIIVVVCVHVVLSAWSTYRRIWQVLRIDLRVSSTVLGPGATVTYDVVTSGETYNRILLELVQDVHAETLFERRGEVNAVNTYDPRVFDYAGTVTITPELLERFAPGSATLRPPARCRSGRGQGGRHEENGADVRQPGGPSLVRPLTSRICTSRSTPRAPIRPFCSSAAARLRC